MGDAKRRHSKDRRRNRARQVQFATEGFTSYAHLLTNFTGCLGWKPCQDSARMASTTDAFLRPNVDEREKRHLIDSKWPSEILIFRAEIEVLQGLLREREHG